MKKKIVKDLNKEDSWKEMDGSTNLEKKLNHYLTRQFILTEDVPSDECLKEARDIIRIIAIEEN